MINVGDVVRDSITGFEGVVVSSHQYLHGCMRLTVQPQSLHDGKPIETQTFDEPQLILVTARNIQGRRDVGGPRNEPSRPAIPGRAT